MTTIISSVVVAKAFREFALKTLETRVDIQPTTDGMPSARLRCGTAVVEFAVALPLLFLIVFGSIQACNAVFSKQFITEVSYQGAMAASRPNVAKSAVIAEMSQIVAARGITTATYEIVGVDGTSFDLLPPGQMFKVTITVPSSTNQSGPSVASYTALQAESYGRKQ